jgi:hypothetical protein
MKKKRRARALSFYRSIVPRLRRFSSGKMIGYCVSPYVVAYVRATHPENDIFGDVRRVVSNAFQIACYQQCVEVFASMLRILLHARDEGNESFVLHAINDVVHLEDRLSDVGLAIDE